MICKPFKNCTVTSVTQKFNVPNTYPPYFHTGVDFVSSFGTGLVAPVTCRITNIIDDIPWQSPEAEAEEIRKGYGLVMQSVEQPDTYYLYWHCLPNFPVSIGQIVEQGRLVAQMGNTGYVLTGGQYVPIGNRFIPPYKGTHLHYEGFKEVNGKREYFDVLSLIDWEIEVKYDYDSVLNIIKKMFNILCQKKQKNS